VLDAVAEQRWFFLLRSKVGLVAGRGRSWRAQLDLLPKARKQLLEGLSEIGSLRFVIERARGGVHGLQAPPSG